MTVFFMRLTRGKKKKRLGVDTGTRVDGKITFSFFLFGYNNNFPLFFFFFFSRDVFRNVIDPNCFFFLLFFFFFFSYFFFSLLSTPLCS